MDFRNVLIAIVLSTLVLVFWATFFEPPPIENKVTENQIEKSEESSSPSIETIETQKKISRDESIKSVDRIKLENENIKGLKNIVFDNQIKCKTPKIETT